MKTIGLIGGELGIISRVLPHPQCRSEAAAGRFSFGQVHPLQRGIRRNRGCLSNGEWEKAGRILNNAARGLEAAGAHFILVG